MLKIWPHVDSPSSCSFLDARSQKPVLVNFETLNISYFSLCDTVVSMRRHRAFASRENFSDR